MVSITIKKIVVNDSDKIIARQYRYKKVSMSSKAPLLHTFIKLHEVRNPCANILMNSFPSSENNK